MKITEKQLQKRLDSVTKKLYATKGIKDTPKSEMVTVKAPMGALIIAPCSMSEKDFNNFRLKWVLCMERLIKKTIEDNKKLKTKKNGKNISKKN